jgi:hypothetical protein
MFEPIKEREGKFVKFDPLKITVFRKNTERGD